MKDTKNFEYTCPDCGKHLEFMAGYHQDDSFVAIFHCEKCKDGIDSDWEVTYTKENGIEKIRRYFFG